MNTFEPDVARLLERVVPPRRALGDWGAVVRSARSVQAAQRTRRRLLAGALTAMALAVSLLVGLRPFGSGGDVVTRAFADRALAVVGAGPVLHVIVRVESPGAVIDLATGRRETPYAVIEEWYEPGAALREKVLQSNGGYIPGSVSVRSSVEGTFVSALPGFTTRYRAALHTGRAEIVERGTVAGRRAIWIRFRPATSDDVPAGVPVGDSSYEVAVDEETYLPLYVRVRSHGRILGHSGVRVLSIDSQSALPRGIAAVSLPDDSDPPMYGEDSTGALTHEQANASMGRPALWLGREYAGLPLAWIGGIGFAYGRAPTYDQIKDRWLGVSVVYGRLAYPATGFPDRNRPYVELREESASELAAIGRAVLPAPGTLLSHDLREGSGSVVVNGVFVEIDAPNEQLLLKAARALEPIRSGG